MRALPVYAWAGMLVMVVSEAGMFAKLEPFYTFHTPIAWTGYILCVDGWVWKRRGDSWLRDARTEFLFLVIFSVPLWLVFELFNLSIRNWHYIGLPESRPLRLLGYAWSFATIWPAIFETGDLLASFRTSRVRSAGARLTRLTTGHWTSMTAGALMLVFPIVWPSRYLAAPVWLGFIFLLDPLNARLTGESLFAGTPAPAYARAILLAWAGIICGLLWESWNYWAGAKWIYTVPIMENWKIFEMPVLGYLGFPAFALECFTMYVGLRWLLWRGARRPIPV